MIYSCYSAALFYFQATSTRVKHWKYRTRWNHFGSLLASCSFSQIPVCTAPSISDGQNPEHLSSNAFWPRDWQSRPMSRMMIGQRLSALWVFSQWPDDPGEDSKWSGSALVTHSTQATPPWQFAAAMHTQKRCMILCQIFFIKIILRATKPPRWHPKSWSVVLW